MISKTEVGVWLKALPPMFPTSRKL